MIKKITRYILLLTFMSCNTVYAQKGAFEYPFKFSSTRFKTVANAVNLLADKGVDHLSMIIHDKKKADYIEFDKNLKIVSSFSLPAKDVSFSKYDIIAGDYDMQHVGSFALPASGIFNFVYSLQLHGNPAKESFMATTVDFNKKSATDKEIIERNGQEITLQSFSDDGHFYCVRANNKEEQLVFYLFNSEGKLTKKSIPFKVPVGKKKDRNSITEYLGNAALIKNNEEPDIEQGTAEAKIYFNSTGIVFVVNDGASPTHLIKFDKNTLALKETFIDHSSLFPDADKNKSAANSYLSEEKLFSVIVNKNDLVVAEYRLDGVLVNKQEINEENMHTVLSSPIKYEERKGAKVKEDQIDNFSKLLKVLHNQSTGITVGTTKDNNYVITIGTYEPIMISSATVGRTSHSTEGNRGGVGPSLPAGNNYINAYYTPGISTYSKSSNYFKKTTFRIMTDGNSFINRKSKHSKTLRDQIQDFMEDQSKNMRKQFAIGEKQYLGYYDSNTNAYYIENIPVKK